MVALYSDPRTLVSQKKKKRDDQDHRPIPSPISKLTEAVNSKTSKQTTSCCPLSESS